MTPATRLTAAGFFATAVSFGPARMGFGLFLPAFREDFALATATAGLVASAGFLSFLIALLASAWIGRRYGERACVIAGALAASAGFATVAAAGTPGLLAIGIALAGASAGLCWAPFNNAAERVVREDARAGALSVVSTGTSFGIVAAAALSLAVTAGALGWRGAWIAFALAALALVAIARTGMPPRQRRQRRQGSTFKAVEPVEPPGLSPTDRAGEAAGAAGATDAAATGGSLVSRAVVPLYATALCFGVTNAVFLSFAADRVVAAGGLPGLPDEAASAVIFLGYGIFGVLGLATGRIEARIGLAPLFCAILAAAAMSLVLVALAPTSWIAVVAASGLHGVAIMMASAVFSFWSLRLFPGRGTEGFTATLLGAAVGSVLGPALAGLLADAEGPRVMFLVAALPPLAAALWFGARVRPPRPRPRLSRD